MKSKFNIFYMLISFLIVFGSCNKDVENNSSSISKSIYIDQFLKSKSFSKEKILKTLGISSFELRNTDLRYVSGRNISKVPILLSYIYENNKIVGSIEAVRYTGLKGEFDFNILLRSFVSFDFVIMSGNLDLFDLTDNKRLVTLSVVNEKIVKAYPNFDLFRGDELETRKHPMDLNDDGNVTFSECYKYANEACAADPECYTLCYGIGDAAGWVITKWGPLCQGAIASACVVTALKN